MEYVTLPETELTLSRVVVGTWALGGHGWGTASEPDMQRAILAAIDQGVTCIDTADVYGLGRAETILGELLRGRDDIVISTKVGVRWDDSGRTSRDASPEYVVKALDDSLQRLRRERIDLYQIHWPDPATPVGATLEVLSRAQALGKVQYIGCSNFSRAQIIEAQQFAPVVSVQAPFNLLDRRASTDLLAESDPPAAVLAYAPLAQGMLTGKHGADAHFGPDDVRSRSGYFDEGKRQAYLQCVDAVRDLANKFDRTAGQVAIRWALDTPGVSAVIVGAKTTAQARDNVAIDWHLPPADYERLDASSRSVGRAS